MKAIVFTLDAVFALVIAFTTISILLYFHYYTEIPYQTRYIDAQSTLLSLAESNITAISGVNTTAQQIINQNNAYLDSSPLLVKNSAHSPVSEYGPLYPSISYIFTANSAITTAGFEDYGNVYFIAGSTIYAINASYGSEVWSESITNGPGTPLLYKGNLYITNSTSLVALDAENGNVLWSTPITAYGSSASIKIINNGDIVFATSSDNLLGFYPENGSLAWHYSIPAAPIGAGLLSIQGGVVIATSTNSLIMVKPYGSSAYTLWTIPSVTSTPASAINSSIIFANSESANAVNIGGVQLFSPISLPEPIVGVTASPNLFLYQTTNSLLALSPEGKSVWYKPMPSGITQPATSGDYYYPMISSSDNMVYSIWSNYIVAQNLSNGKIVWTMNSIYGNIGSPSLAYGHLFLPEGNTLVALGTCSADPGTSLLSSIATLYLNNEGSCADSLINSVRPTSNYSLYINGTFAPGLGLAKFNGINSSIEVPNSSSLDLFHEFTISFWVNKNAYSSNCGTIIGKPGSSGMLIYSQTSNGCSAGSTNNQPLVFKYVDYQGTTHDGISSPPLPSSQWINIILSVNLGANDNLTPTWYVNGAMYLNGLKFQRSYGDLPPPGFNTYPLYIGSGDNPFNGSIANVQIYRIALNSSQAEDIFSRGIEGAPISGQLLSAWYPLDGNANDYSGNGNVGYPSNVGYEYSNYTISGILQASEVSKSSTVLPSSSEVATLSGSGSSIAISPSSSLSFTGSKITLGAWVKIVKNNGNINEIISNEPTGGGFYLWIDSSNKVHFGVDHGAAEVVSTGSLSYNKWYQVFGVYNGATLTLYINGNENNSISSTSGIVTTGWTFIGGYGGNSDTATSNLLNGSVSNVQIYKYPLTNTQVSNLFAEGITSPPVSNAGLSGWWPLNGNANDYSSNWNNGVQYNVDYKPYRGLYDVSVYTWG